MKTTATIDQVVKQFEAESDIQPQSKVIYMSILKGFYIWLGKNGYSTREPTIEAVLRYKTELSVNKTYQTANLYLTVIKKYFRWLDRKTYFENITESVKFFQRYRGYIRTPLTEDQTRALLKSVDLETLTGNRDYLIILMLTICGIRAIELTRINRNDLYNHLDKTYFRIQPKGSTQKTETIEVTEINPYIERYLKTIQEENKGPFFISLSRRNRGNRLSTRSVRQIVTDHLKKIGITDKTITTHSLRHTSANILLENDFSIFEVQGHLGHSSANTTAHYTQWAQNKVRYENKTGRFLLKTILK